MYTLYYQQKYRQFTLQWKYMHNGIWVYVTVHGYRGLQELIASYSDILNVIDLCFNIFLWLILLF